MARGAEKAPRTAARGVPAVRELAEVAGEIKVARKMSIADCFAAALAKQTRT
jgi:hypothetical protein